MRSENSKNGEELSQKFNHLQKQYDALTQVIDSFQNSLIPNQEAAGNLQTLHNVFLNLKDKLNQAEGKLYNSFSRILSLNEGINFIQLLFINGYKGNNLFESIIKKFVEVTGSDEGVLEISTPIDHSEEFGGFASEFEIKYKAEHYTFPHKESKLISSFGEEFDAFQRYSIHECSTAEGSTASLLKYILVAHKKVVGAIFLSNKSEKFTEETVQLYEPLFQSCISIIEAIAIETKKELSEARFREKEVLFTEAQKIANLGWWEHNLLTDQLWWSEHVYEIFGLKPKHSHHSSDFFFSHVHPDDIEMVRAATDKALREGKEYLVDHRIIKPNGDIKFVRENAKVITDSSGRPVKLLGTVLDLTYTKNTEEKIDKLVRDTQIANEELQASEEELRQTLDTTVGLNEKLLESETRLKEAQEIARLARWEFLVGKKAFIWSKEMYELYGETETNAAQKREDPLAIIHPDDRGKLLEQGRLAIIHKKDFEFDIRVPRKDGTIAWVVGKGKPVINENGKLLKYVGIAMDISDRKNAELAIKRSEELFKALIQNSSDFVHLTDENGIITYESPAVEKILGYGEGEILGKNIFDLSHPSDRENLKRIFDELKQTPGESALIEVRLQDKSGEWIWMESLGTNLLGDQSVHSFVFNNRDISERKQAQGEIGRLLQETQTINLELRSSEEEIRQTLKHSMSLNQKLVESQEQLKEAQEIAKLGRWEYDFLEQKIYWSEEVYKIFGIQDLDLSITQDLFKDKISKEDRGKVFKSIKESEQFGKTFKLEAKVHTPNGDKWIYLIGKPSINLEGEVVKLIIVVLDITERKQAEIALQKNEKLFRQLIENSQDGIYLVDSQSTIIYASPSSVKILGYQVHEIIDRKNNMDLVHPDHKEYVQEKYSELSGKPGHVLTVVYKAKHIDGSWRWIENIAKNLLHDADINAIVINSRDINDSKEAQIALEDRERKFRKLIENSHDGIAISDANGIPFYLSDSIQNILGFTANEMLTLDGVKDLIHPEDIQKVAESSKALTSIPNHITTQNLRVKHKDGNYRWIYCVSTNLLHDPDVKGVVNNFKDITERKLAEEKLKESERRYRMLMEEASDGILLSDKNGKYISVNNRGCQMLGYTHEELLNMTVQEIVPNNTETKTLFNYKDLDKGKSILTERYMQRKNGNIFPVEISAKKLDDNTYQAFVRDITERRNAEEIIKKSEAELNALFHALPDLIIVFNKNSEFLRISSNIPDLAYPPGNNLIGKNVFDVLPPAEASFMNKYIQKCLHTLDSIQTEYSIDFKGNKVWFTVTVSPMPDEKVVWVARDTSHKKRAEEELMNSKNYLDKIINTIPEPVFVKDETHKWILLNDAICDYLGYPREHLLGKTDYDFFPHEKAQSFWEKDEIVMQTGEDNLMEEEIQDYKGHRHTLILKKSLYHDPHRGKLVVGIINDITDRKRIEKKLQNQNEELTKINAELDKFVYRASHDLRAPLVSILGLINIAKMENNLEKNLQYFGLMERSINKLDNFIQSIISYSRNSRLELTIEKIDIHKLVEEAFDDLKYIEASKKIAISVNVEGREDFYSDLFRLKIIFNNIISNAIRYSNPRREEPYLKINVTVTHELAVFRFEDNGIGIAEECIAKIFDMFYRASESNVGSGLGLYIVKDVVETMKGNIKVNSTLGEGTTFIITLLNSASQ